MSTDVCVSQSDVCDGIGACPDFTDELQCGKLIKCLFKKIFESFLHSDRFYKQKYFNLNLTKLFHEPLSRYFQTDSFEFLKFWKTKQIEPVIGNQQQHKAIFAITLKLKYVNIDVKNHNNSRNNNNIKPVVPLKAFFFFFNYHKFTITVHAKQSCFLWD